MCTYKLPDGIRIPTADEYPAGNNVDEINKSRSAANIVQGYKIYNIENKNYTHVLEVNIDVDKIYEVFVSLSNAILPDIAYGILGFKDNENGEDILSNYTYKSNVINLFNNYAYELSNDGLLTFGIAFSDDTSLNEIFVSSFKYFKIWTNSISKVINVLNEYNINQIENIQFIDEFPVCSWALTPDMQKGIRHYNQVTEEIKAGFEEFTI